jgi:hypothetical protein
LIEISRFEGGITIKGIISPILEKHRPSGDAL